MTPPRASQVIHLPPTEATKLLHAAHQWAVTTDEIVEDPSTTLQKIPMGRLQVNTELNHIPGPPKRCKPAHNRSSYNTNFTNGNSVEIRTLKSERPTLPHQRNFRIT